MKIKVEQMIYLGLAFLLAGAFIWFLTGIGIVTAIAGVFVFVVGSFLGVDLVRMIRKTEEMPKGKFDKTDKWKYLVSMVFLILLTAEALFISRYFSRDMTGVFASVGVGAMVVVGLLISGIEANKVVTGEKANLE